MDHKYLLCILQKFGGAPVGVETLSAALSEERDTIEDVIEPYLVREGYVKRTPRGRMVTADAFDHLIDLKKYDMQDVKRPLRDPNDSQKKMNF